MEYVDVYNSDGKSLGFKKTGKEAHQKGLWHKTVHIWIVNSKKELLIQKRSPLMDNHPNEWDISVAGHISTGENEITAALRETSEEIGLEIIPEKFKLIKTIKKESVRSGYINNEIISIYIIKMEIDLKKIKRQEEEISELKLIPYKKLKQIIENKDPLFVPHPEEYKILFKFLENDFGDLDSVVKK